MMYPGGAGNHEGAGLHGMIFLSLLAHFLFLSFLIFSPSQSAPKWTFGPVYSVQLVSMPTGLPERRDRDASLREVLEGVPTDRSLLKKESIDTLPSVPIGPVERIKKSVPDMENVLERIRKNVQSSPNPPAPSTALKGTERITPPPTAASSSARQSDADLNEKMRAYYALLWSRIKGLWTLPQGMLPRENIEVVIHVQILRDGTVVNAGFEKRSGNRYFDESALRTVKKASPFPPLPEGLRDNSIDLGIRFHSSEFR